jgi:hypothetical protein
MGRRKMETREKKGKSKGRVWFSRLPIERTGFYLHIEIFFGIIGLYARIGEEG